MRILIYSPLFYPSVGGLETIVSILAHEFVRQGHDVKLVCSTIANEPDAFPFDVYRRSSPYELLKLTDWCDIYFQANVSLKGIWPLIIKRKPLAISHNGWYSRSSGRIGWQDRLKQQVSRHAYNISVSRAVADHLSSESAVIPNAYRDDIFYLMPEVPRKKHLVFLGRLVSDKGADLLLDALAQLKSKGLCPQLTIIGNGPERETLRRQAIEYEVDSQIEFAGLKTGAELTRMLNEHLVMVIPSRCNEGFGIVALEGIACGCVIVGSESGGLKDAIGPCGVVFSKGDVTALTEALFNILRDESALTAYRSYADEHLARHKIESVAKAYLQVFKRAVEA
jgi:glycosyltransferase involved in cell wall biosynthesis